MSTETIRDAFGSAPTPVADETLEKLKKVSVTTITGVLARLGISNCYMQNVPPRTKACNFAGTAFTMRTVPTREDIVAAGKGRASLHRQSFIKVGKNQCLVFDARGEQGSSRRPLDGEDIWQRLAQECTRRRAQTELGRLGDAIVRLEGILRRARGRRSRAGCRTRRAT